MPQKWDFLTAQFLQTLLPAFSLSTLNSLPCGRKKTKKLVQIESICRKHLYSLPNDKILDWTKFKVIADNKLDVTKIMISLRNRVENTVGIGEDAGYQHFLLSSQCFRKVSSKVSFSGLLKDSM